MLNCWDNHHTDNSPSCRFDIIRFSVAPNLFILIEFSSAFHNHSSLFPCAFPNCLCLGVIVTGIKPTLTVTIWLIWSALLSLFPFLFSQICGDVRAKSNWHFLPLTSLLNRTVFFFYDLIRSHFFFTFFTFRLFDTCQSARNTLCKNKY